jgi:hypothetical protein
LTVCKIYENYLKGVPCPKYHYLLEYLAELWEATSDKKQVYDSIQLSNVARVCAENPEQYLKEKKVLTMVDLTPLLPHIPVQSWWWVLLLTPEYPEEDEDVGMSFNLSISLPIVVILALLPDMPDLNLADDSGQAPRSPDNEAPSCTTPEKDEVCMDDDGGVTPCRVMQRAAKHSIVISPTQEGPAAQCAKMDKPVSFGPTFWVGELIPLP